MAKWTWLLPALVTFPTLAALPQDKAAELAKLSGLSAARVQQMMAGVQKRPAILKAISTPWEAKPWYQYRALFLTQKRINEGLAFWQQHQALLARAQATYQVPASVIVAIIGVETYYGRHMGTYPVRDALYTLGFYYPKRSAFFFKELGQYLKLADQQQWQQSPNGSYAGAMGMGQFIPSSYQHYAVDFDHDGKRDLFSSPADAIGSVANYFHEHHWRMGEPVLAAATVQSPPKLDNKLELNSTLAALKKQGVTAAIAVNDSTPARLFAFKTANGTDYQLGFHNFYVITRYNRSPLYARAVWQLAQALEQQHAG